MPPRRTRHLLTTKRSNISHLLSTRRPTVCDRKSPAGISHPYFLPLVDCPECMASAYYAALEEERKADIVASALTGRRRQSW